MGLIIVVGSGGHARVLVDALLVSDNAVFGFVDADPSLHGTTIMGIAVLGGDDAVLPGSLLVNGIGSVGNPSLRIKMDKAFTDRGFHFLTVRHPTAVIGRDVILGEGSQIMAGAIVQTGAILGRHAIINTAAAVDHDCCLGDYVHIAPGAVLSGNVRVGEGSHIGTGAVVIQGIRIGANCLIAAGSVVVNDVPDGTRVQGVPAAIAGLTAALDVSPIVDPLAP